MRVRASSQEAKGGKKSPPSNGLVNSLRCTPGWGDAFLNMPSFRLCRKKRMVGGAENVVFSAHCSCPIMRPFFSSSSSSFQGRRAAILKQISKRHRSFGRDSHNAAPLCHTHEKKKKKKTRNGSSSSENLPAKSLSLLMRAARRRLSSLPPHPLLLSPSRKPGQKGEEEEEGKSWKEDTACLPAFPFPLACTPAYA